MITCIDTSPIADGLFENSGRLDHFLPQSSRFSPLVIADAAAGNSGTDDEDESLFRFRQNDWRAFNPKKGFRDASSNWEEMMFYDLDMEPVETVSERSPSLACRFKNMVQAVFSLTH